MAKKRTPEQEAIARAKRMPERKWFVSRRMTWAWGTRPFKWGFFTNYRGFSLDIGNPKIKFHGPEVPESQLNMALDFRPFRFIVFWHRKRIIWIGDWEWKKSLRSG